MLGYDTSRAVRMVISSLVSGGIAVLTNILTGFNADGQISKGTLTVALISGALLALKDAQAFLSTPPKNTPAEAVAAAIQENVERKIGL